MSTTPGRLTGWGLLGDGLTLEETLPSGWDAENIVAVSAGEKNWAALRADGKVITGGRDSWAKQPVPNTVGPCKAIDMGLNFCLAVRLNGTIAVWGAYSSDVSARAELIEKAVAVAGGYKHAMAITEDGTMHFWSPWYDPESENGKKLGNLVEELTSKSRNVLAVNSEHGRAIALKKDGSVLQWAYRIEPFGITEVPEYEESPRIARVDTGIGWLFAIDEAGNLRGKFPGSLAIPENIGPVEFARSGRTFIVAKQHDGTVRAWGDPFVPIDLTPARFESLIDFDFGKSHVRESNFVIGIEPSYLSGFNVSNTKTPELTTALAALETERLAADDDLVAFENRYLAELEKLKAAAAQNDRKKIVSRIAGEIANFRDRDRPPFTEIKRLADLQKIYRDGAPEREKELEEKFLGIYEKAVNDLQALQDSLTQAQKLQPAVEVRTEKEKIAVALELLKNPPAPVLAQAADVPKALTFEPIPEDQKVFAIGDTRCDGELVTLGTVDGFALKYEESNGRKVMGVSAAGQDWLSLKTDGTYFGQAKNKPILGNGSLPRLKQVYRNRVTYGFDRSGKLEIVDPASPMAPPQPWDGIIAVESQYIEHLHSLALFENGTVKGYGPYYKRERLVWKVPPEVTAANDITEITVSNYAACVLRKDGSILWWNETGLLKSPEIASGLVQISGGGKGFVGLRKDGTVAVWTSQTSDTPVLRVPPKLTDIVEVAGGIRTYLALRADGTWVSWGVNEDNLFDQLEKIKGVRWLDIGGYSDERFIVGIRPDPADLKK